MDDLIYKHALHNAVRYEGKANPGAVIAKVVGEDPELKKDMKVLGKKVSEVVKKVNSLGLDKQKEELGKIAPDLLEEKKIVEERKLPPLKNVEGPVVLRVAPYPSGPLHIGNTKQVIINDEYAKIYKGKLLLIFDDTIGSDEKQIDLEAYDLIKEGFDWLGVNYDKNLIYKSDRIEIYYKYADEIIKKGAAYVCHCSAEKLRENRAKGLECSCRGKDVKNILDEWGSMLKGKYKEGEVILRLKTSMTHPNPAFRDRVLFRISNREHPKVGKKYFVWPMLEFSWAIDDYLLKVSHVIRGKELMIESDMEKFIWGIFGWKGPELIHTGLLHIEGVKLSKSKSQKEVKEGKYIGWDDPRAWSLQSLKRRGFRPEAIRKFCLSFGVNEKESSVTVDKFYAENRKLVEPDANRYFLVDDPVEIEIEGFKGKEVELRLHPDNLDRGSRKLVVSNKFYISKKDFERIEDGKVNRLMDCVNFVKKGSKFVFDSEDHSGFKSSSDKGLIMHYLPVGNCVDFEVLVDDGSILKGVGETNLVNVKVGEVIQAERRFFCRLDSVKDNLFKFWYTHK